MQPRQPGTELRIALDVLPEDGGAAWDDARLSAAAAVVRARLAAMPSGGFCKLLLGRGDLLALPVAEIERLAAWVETLLADARLRTACVELTTLLEGDEPAADYASMRFRALAARPGFSVYPDLIVEAAALADPVSEFRLGQKVTGLRRRFGLCFLVLRLGPDLATRSPDPAALVDLIDALGVEAVNMELAPDLADPGPALAFAEALIAAWAVSRRAIMTPALNLQEKLRCHGAATDFDSLARVEIAATAANLVLRHDGSVAAAHAGLDNFAPGTASTDMARAASWEAMTAFQHRVLLKAHAALSARPGCAACPFLNACVGSGGAAIAAASDPALACPSGLRPLFARLAGMERHEAIACAAPEPDADFTRFLVTHGNG